MGKLGKIICTLAIVLVMGISITTEAYAEGTLTVEADKDTCQSGDSFSITINALAEGDSAVPPQVRVEFDANRLQFDNCSVQYGGGNGGLIDFSDNTAKIDFTTLSGGEAKIGVSAILSDDSTDITYTEFAINVEGEDTAGAMQESVEEVATGVSEASIEAGEGRLVQAVFASEFMPVMFHKATTQFKGQQVECAQFDMGDLTLLYTTDEIGSDGVFCIYNTASGEISPLKVIMGIENRFIIILSDYDGEIPAGYAKSIVNWDGTTHTAYVPEHSSAAFGGLNSSDFFLVYAISSEGVKGWYQYDKMEGTFQRFLQMTGDDAGAGNGNNGGSSSKSGASGSNFLSEYISADIQAILLLVFLGLTVILFIVVIVLAVKNSEYGYYEEEYYEEDDEEPEYRPKKSITASSIVDETMNEDDEEDEEDEEDGNDSEDDTEEDDADEDARADEDEEDESDEDDDIEILEDEKVKNRTSSATRKRQIPQEEEDEEDEEEEEDYFDPRWTRKERKEIAKQRKKAEKEAAKDEKWRLKEERKAQKMRAMGYEEASPMDWSTFGESMSDKKDDRRPMGKGNLPSYMTDKLPKEEIEEMDEQEEVMEEKTEKSALPPRKISPAMSEQKEAESAMQFKEDEMRKKQKRLFEQQQRIEEQRRIEEEQYELRQRQEQQKFILNQQVEEDLDEDFQFEFLDL